MSFADIKARTEALRGVKHTEGPWAVDAGYIVGLSDPAHADTIAEFSEARPSDEDGKCIAAAPEAVADRAELVAMVEALVAVLEHISRACDPGVDQSDDEMDAFIANVRELSRAALAKVQS